jgi:hypothetical protein
MHFDTNNYFSGGILFLSCSNNISAPGTGSPLSGATSLFTPVDGAVEGFDRETEQESKHNTIIKQRKTSKI